MTTYITVYAKRRNFTILGKNTERADTSYSYEITGEQILWDDGTDIQWDDATQILWSTHVTAYPINIQAQRRSFTILANGRYLWQDQQ